MSTQLALPIPGLGTEQVIDAQIPRPGRVFVNRNLRLSGIDWVGFDMDYTLAIYRQPAMDSLSVELTVERLIRRGYPAELADLEYDIRFPIRGLLIDKQHGHVLKMNRFKAVYQGYHGLRRLSQTELETLYWEDRIQPQTERYHWIDTLFGLSEVTSYAAIISALEKRGVDVDFSKLFDDIRDSIDKAHREGVVYKHVTADMDRFLDRDDSLARTLHKFRSAGKRLFVLTNSPAHYTESVMSYLLDGAMPEYSKWQNYFDAVIVGAKKPLWFNEGTPLRECSGSRRIEVSGALERGKIYEGGGLQDFETRMGMVGSKVLYVGDHIYGDILKSKKESSWRTAMIIQELAGEVAAYERAAGDLNRQRALQDVREKLEDELRFYQGRLKSLPKSRRPTADQNRFKLAIGRVRSELRSINEEQALLEDGIRKSFHPYWGSLLKDQGGTSSFGHQVETYADIYMRRVSCLRRYSPEQFFRCPYDFMPHEL